MDPLSKGASSFIFFTFTSSSFKFFFLSSRIKDFLTRCTLWPWSPRHDGARSSSRSSPSSHRLTAALPYLALCEAGAQWTSRRRATSRCCGSWRCSKSGPSSWNRRPPSRLSGGGFRLHDSRLRDRKSAHPFDSNPEPDAPADIHPLTIPNNPRPHQPKSSPCKTSK